MVVINPFSKELEQGMSVYRPPSSTGISTSAMPNPWQTPTKLSSVSVATPKPQQPAVPPTVTSGVKTASAPTHPSQPSATQLEIYNKNTLSKGYAAPGYLENDVYGKKLAGEGWVYGTAPTTQTQQPAAPVSPTTPTTTTETTTPSTNWADAFYSKYGIDKVTSPTLPAPTDTMSEYGLTNDQIQAQLEQQKAAIKAKYDILRGEAETKTESERQANLSGLYSLGEVNPLSSGTASIGTASQDVLNKRKDALSAMESEEVAAAIAAAFGQKFDAQGRARQAQQDTEQRIKDQYALEQSTREENVNSIKNAMAMVASGKQLEQADKDNAWKGISNLLTNFGSGAFDGADASTLEQMEKAAGIPKGTLSRGLKTIKEQELLGKANNLKEVDGTLYNITYDANGNPKADVVVKGTPKSEASLTPAQINSTVNAIAGAFDNEPIVKSYNTAQEGYQTIKNIGVSTKSPADDIAFIYAFAKIMDPNSVVREGEYNTIQKYAQTWADTFGFSAKRIFSNTNFLSSDAKQKMLNALEPKINTLSSQYNNLYQEYQRQIDDAYSGKARQITDYSKPFTSDDDPLGLFSSGGGNQPFKSEGSDSDNRSVLGLGRITGFGSKYWKPGLDIDLKKGDPVPSPVSGKVIFAGNNKGFGNQVQVLTSSGNKVWLSHLDAIGVKVGDTISKGQYVGKGGNTGNVYSDGGGDGSHLDLTVQKPDGTYFTAKEVYDRLKNFV